MRPFLILVGHPVVTQFPNHQHRCSDQGGADRFFYPQCAILDFRCRWQASSGHTRKALPLFLLTLTSESSFCQLSSLRPMQLRLCSGAQGLPG